MIELVNDRSRALDALIEAVRERVKIGLRDFIESINGFELVALVDGEETVGSVLTKGNEVHIAIRTSYRRRWYSRRLKRTILGALIRDYGCAVTSVMKDNPRGIQFVEALGFQRAFEDRSKIHYKLERL